MKMGERLTAGHKLSSYPEEIYAMSRFPKLRQVRLSLETWDSPTTPKDVTERINYQRYQIVSSDDISPPGFS